MNAYFPLFMRVCVESPRLRSRPPGLVEVPGVFLFLPRNHAEVEGLRRPVFAASKSPIYAETGTKLAQTVPNAHRMPTTLEQNCHKTAANRSIAGSSGLKTDSRGSKLTQN